MVEIPDNKVGSYWLFSDNIIGEYKFLGFNLKYKTTTGKEIPALILYGKIKGKEVNSTLSGEIVTSLWNISNLKELKQKLGNDTDLWSVDTLYFRPTKDGNKIKFDVV